MGKANIRYIVLFALVASSIVVALAMALRAWDPGSRQVAPSLDFRQQPLSQAALMRLSRALQFETVSNSGEQEHAAFAQFRAFIAESYPEIQRSLEQVPVVQDSLVLHWPGRNNQLKPVILLAHQDVVPVEETTRDLWTHPPFAGVITEKHVWGRGALDDKCSMLAMLEAATRLLDEGFVPQRSIFFAFGHDEESGGIEGAKKIAEYFAKAGVRAHLLLDEGHVITDGILPGIDQPVALIGLAEKGYATARVSVSATGGHSSMPPEHSAIGVLAKKLAQIEAQPMRPTMNGPLREMFNHSLEGMSFSYRLIFANLWLLEPVVTKVLETEASTNALLRTTAAITQISGGVSENTLPKQAEATINFRIHPQDSIDSVISHLSDLVEDGETKVLFDDATQAEPSSITPISHEGYEQLAQAIRTTWPQALVAPSLTIGGTDSRHYANLADAIFRFRPLLLRADDLDRFHGVNERIGIENYARSIDFYAEFLRLATQAPQ